MRQGLRFLRAELPGILATRTDALSPRMLHVLLGNISKRGNRYLRSLFVQAVWVVLVKIGPKHWDPFGLQSWIEAAKKRPHHNALAVALANKLARIAWAVLHKGRAFECVKTNEAAYRPA